MEDGAANTTTLTAESFTVSSSHTSTYFDRVFREAIGNKNKLFLRKREEWRGGVGGHIADRFSGIPNSFPFLLGSITTKEETNNLNLNPLEFSNRSVSVQKSDTPWCE